ncbi:alpha/beta-hydrolase family protein [Corynebacterium sp. 335C]
MEKAIAVGSRPQLFREYDLVGLVVAALAAASAYTPSLLPRTWFYQGLVAGIAAAMGYATGVVLHRAWTALGRALARSDRVRRARESARARLRSALPGRLHRETVASWAQVAGVVMLVAVIAGSLWASIGWQRELAQEMAKPLPGLWHVLLALPTSLLVFWLLLVAARGLAAWADAMAALARRAGLGESAAVGASWTAVAVVLTLLVGSVMPSVGVRLAEPYFIDQNLTYRQDLEKPAVPERAAGPGSAVDWDGLGYEGSRFIADGLYAGELERVTGRPAEEPIRLYAGLGNGDTMRERADLLVRELERTGAASREAVMIMPVTGTGWANPVSAQAFELLHDGDTAIVSAQYGVLPSALSVFVDRNIAADPSRELVAAVAAWWAGIPEGERPKLYLYGESLGTQGVEAGLTSMWPTGLLPDGVLMVGPPQGNDIHRWFTERRRPASPEVRPEGPDMSGVRFAVSGDDAIRRARDPEWPDFRILYMQHDTDPVVWWSPALIWNRPDWLAEAPGPARSPSMEWRFFVTFWQVSADLAGAAEVPDGYGHNYADEIIDGWIAVTGDPRTAPADRAALHGEMDRAMEGQGPEKGHITGLDEAG